jgi:hypothetical protein
MGHSSQCVKILGLTALFLAIAADASCAEPADQIVAHECQFEENPGVVVVSGDPHIKGSQILQVWDVPNRPVFWTVRRPISDSNDAFLVRLRNSGVETDPVKVMERASMAQERHNNTIVIREARSWIGPINCLEMLLFSVQNDRINILDDPTEFISFILRSNDGARLRVIFFSKNEYTIGNVSSIVARVAQDRARGWAVAAVLHNHNFQLLKREPSGVVAPSIADAHLNRGLADRLQMEEAWITNGISTVRIPAQYFGQFQTDP